MKSYLSLFLALCAFALSAIAQSSTPTPDAEYLLYQRDYASLGDTAVEIHVRTELKLYRSRAINAYALNGESFIVYNPDFEQLTINDCHTLLPDGRRLAPRPSAFVDQLPASCADCGRFNNIRELAIVHPGLEPNCVIVLDYTLRRFSPLYAEHVSMQQPYPVRLYQVTLNGDTLFSLRNIPQNDFALQPFAPRSHEYDFDINLGAYPAFLSETTLPEAQPLLDALYNDLAPDTASNLDDNNINFVRSICQWVDRSITHHDGLDLSHLNYQLAPAAEVLRTRCGTPAECMGLAVALLNQAGFSAQLVVDTTVANVSNALCASVLINGMSYVVRSLNPFVARRPGVARDVVHTLSVDTSFSLSFDSSHVNPLPLLHLADGYYRLSLPMPDGINAFNPAALTPSRTAPVVVHPCDEEYECTLYFSDSFSLLGDNVRIKYDLDDIGSIELSIRKSGGKIKIYRHLVLSTDLVDIDAYPSFRQLILDWYSCPDLILHLD